MTVTGYTKVEQPSPWDDYQRGRMLALARYRDDCCPGCGSHASITADPDNVMVPDQKVCPFCAGLAVHERVKRDEDEQFREGLGDRPKAGKAREEWLRKRRPGDGRRLFLRPATAEELAEREKKLQQQRRRTGLRG